MDEFVVLSGWIADEFLGPEVMANKRYNEKADVYSFGMIMWEMVAVKIPFDGMEAMQAAYAVMNESYRPEIPSPTLPEYAQMIRDCWHQDPEARPSWEEVIPRLESMLTKL
jgi:sterile alpha motif and leucine zipper-containing kinase AZK